MMMAAIPGEWWISDGKGVDPISVFASSLAGSTFGVLVAIISVLDDFDGAGIFLPPPEFLFAMARDKLISAS